MRQINPLPCNSVMQTYRCAVEQRCKDHDDDQTVWRPGLLFVALLHDSHNVSATPRSLKCERGKIGRVGGISWGSTIDLDLPGFKVRNFHLPK